MGKSEKRSSNSDVEKFVKFLELIGYREVRVPETDLPDKNDVNLKETLESLREKVEKCCKCRLCKTRTHVVFGEGNPETNLMLIGEAPGEQEDLQGRPFVGRAGQLLTKFLNLFGVSREEVYITNVVKCRPPGNRNPEIDEIRTCYPYLEEQIKLIKPEVILCLGAFSARTILNLPEKTPISGIRGTVQNVDNIKVIPTYHPAYLLRNRKGEQTFQKDLEKALRLSGLI